MYHRYQNVGRSKMALIACSECSARVSDGAFKCPGCGFQLKKPKRSFFGKLFKLFFIIFNLLMAWWMFAGIGAASKHVGDGSSAQQAGAAIGTGIAFTMILVIWVFGDVILGLFVLFTRPKLS
jgi:hypothetical protein